MPFVNAPIKPPNPTEHTYRVLLHTMVINDSTPHTMYDVHAFDIDGNALGRIASFSFSYQADQFVIDRIIGLQ